MSNPRPKETLIKYFCRLLYCETARISIDHNKMYLIIGYKKNSIQVFNFWKEHVVASGVTEKELIASAKEYKRTDDLMLRDYLQLPVVLKRKGTKSYTHAVKQCHGLWRDKE